MSVRYSSSVVAPMVCSSPRASAGLRMLAVSRLPWVDPAPTIVWISSMKTIVSRERRSRSSSCCMRSSNSPRNFVPATRAETSSEKIRLPAMVAGTSPRAIRSASPSTMALLPTPASPIRIGLFFLRRERIWMTRSISRSRPMTGSTFPSRASCVRSAPNCASGWPDGSSKGRSAVLRPGLPTVISVPKSSPAAKRCSSSAMICGVMPYISSTWAVAVVRSPAIESRACPVVTLRTASEVARSSSANPR
ncbi:putative uncharacterized protein [Alistipes sp. CAG:268]|nr:putative uncharacterized protein [Alistipes sp. CAG:268]